MPPRFLVPALLLGTLLGLPLGVGVSLPSALAVAGGLSVVAMVVIRRPIVLIIAAAFVGSTVRVGSLAQRPTVPAGVDLAFRGAVVGVRTEPTALVQLTEPVAFAGRTLRFRTDVDRTLQPRDRVRGLCWTGQLPPPVLRSVLNGTVGSCPRVHLDSVEPGHGVARFLATTRARAAARIARAYPEPSGDFLEGLLVGSPPDASRTLTDQLRRAGVSHLVAVSGYNLTVVVSVLGTLLLPLLGRRIGSLVLAASLLAFAGVSGFEASVLRAAGMALLSLVAYLTGRPAALPRLLGVAVLAAAWWSPALPLFDLGFQLSVAATAGLAFLAQPIARRLNVFPPGELRTSAASSLAALAATVPVLLLTVGRVSIVAPLTTVLLTPFVPAAMLLGSLSLVPVPGAAPLLVAATRTLLEAMLAVARAASDLPFAALSLPSWSAATLLVPVVLWLVHRRARSPVLPGWGRMP